MEYIILNISINKELFSRLNLKDFLSMNGVSIFDNNYIIAPKKYFVKDSFYDDCIWFKDPRVKITTFGRANFY